MRNGLSRFSLEMIEGAYCKLGVPNTGGTAQPATPGPYGSPPSSANAPIFMPGLSTNTVAKPAPK